MQYYTEFNLKNYNSFRLDSIAKEIYFPESNKELRNLILELKDQKYYVLASGTNIIFKPKVSKIICLIKMPKKITFSPQGAIVSANYSTTKFIKEALDKRFINIEGLYEIPGTIGGAIVMNAGSGKYTISDYLLYVTTITSEGNYHIYSREELQFGRRYSILQDKNEIVIEIGFKFERGIKNKKEFLQAKKHRKSFPRRPSAGGIFLNWHELKPYENELIGLSIGDAIISNKINIIVNKGNATFADIMTLIAKIEQIVSNKLFLEVKIMGD